jgi:uncharacterized protein (TIGR02099 family)
MSLIPPAAPRIDPPDAPGRPGRFRFASITTPLLWGARAVLGLVFVVWSILLIAWLTLHWGILPHIEQWRAPIETRASAALGVPVRIGKIEVRSSGWVPSFELMEVVLLGKDQQPALRLPHVFASISPRSLLSFELRFEQLLIDGAELDVRRDPSGRIFVAGLALGDTDSAKDKDKDSSAAADWFFAQHEFVIRGGEVRWTDEQRNAPPLALTNVQFAVRNGLRAHDIRIDATPPDNWGERFSITGRFAQPLLARRGDWHRWSGSVYADLPRADVHELRQHVDLPFELSEGVGALRGWVDLKNGEATAATVDMALRAVSMRLSPDVDPLSVAEVEGRVVAQRNAEGATVSLQHFTFLTGDDIRWPQGDMSFAWRQKEGKPMTGGAITAQKLDVALMAQIGSRIPLGESMRKLLIELAPRGLVSGLTAQWEGPIDAPSKYHAKASVEGLALASHASDSPTAVGRPGLRGASVDFDANEAGGQARISMNGGAVELPGIFEDPQLVLDQMTAQMVWKIEKSSVVGEPPKLTVQVKDGHFTNADAKGELAATWNTSSATSGTADTKTGVAHDTRFPGHLDLDARLVDARAGRTYRYLPMVIGKGTRSYLERALTGGTIETAQFRVKGELSEFPFHDQRNARGGPSDGEFRITARVEDATYAYLPSAPANGSNAAFDSPWSALEKVGVDVLLDHGTLELRNGHAKVGNVDFPQVQGAIRNLEHDATLSIDASGRGPLTEMLHFVNVTPVGGWIGKVLDNSTGTGVADLKLGLTIPLLHADTSLVKGSVGLANNDVRITPSSPILGAAKGRVDFTNKGFAVVGASAKLYGGDATFDGGSQPDGSVRFNGQGTVSADGLKHSAELGAMARAAGALSGQTSYRAALGFVHGQPELNITSTLVGLGIALPAPLAKAADAPLPLHVQTTVDAGSVVAVASGSNVAANDATRDTLKLELGNVIQAQFVRDLTGPEPRVIRGGIGVTEPAPSPANGVAASVALKSLVTDEWQDAADKLFGASDTRDAAASSASTTSAYFPDTIALHVEDLLIGQRRLTHVSAGLSQDAGVWRANLDADQLSGYVEYRLPTRRGGAATAGGRVYARLARLSLPKSDVDQVESLLDQQPASLPALDIVIESFELRGKNLGRIEIEAINRRGAAGGDWLLSKFNVTLPEAQLIGSGSWSAVGSSNNRGAPLIRRSVLDFKLNLSDSGALLDRLGTKGAIKGGKGQLSGQVAWIGSPFSLDYETLSGQIAVAIDSGQFLKVDPGAARLLGVLNLQSLPRRLSLDFRDLFEGGFAFDNITGDVTIEQGVARTNDLRMRGVQAAVLMEGSADIEHETQDLRVVVVPQINAGTAALAYAVINPAIGLGAFLAQYLLKKPLETASTREFQVSGSWADPKVERVEHKAGDDVDAAEAAASSPGK